MLSFFYVGVYTAGGNLLLLRLLVQKGLPTEGLSVLTLNPDTTICPVHYVRWFCFYIIIIICMLLLQIPCYITGELSLIDQKSESYFSSRQH